VAFFFEQLLASLKEVELGDEPVEVTAVGSVDDREDTEAEPRHAVGHRAENLVGVGHGDGDDHGVVYLLD
jgi:hypothetical protein